MFCDCRNVDVQVLAGEKPDYGFLFIVMLQC